MQEAEVWILGRWKPRWEEEQLVRAVSERGRSAAYVDYEDLSVQLHDLRVGGDGGSLPDVVHVRSRVLTRQPVARLAQLYDDLEHMEELGCLLVNSSAAVRVTRNKLRQATALSAAGVRIPPTRAVRNLSDIRDCVAVWGPTVVKPVYGHASIGIVSVGASPKGLRGNEEILLSHILSEQGVLLAQQLVADPLRELRVAVIAGRVVSCYQLDRGAPALRIGLSLGEYQRHPAELTQQLESLGLRTAQTLSLDIAVLDVMETGSGPVVIEANASFSFWETIEGDPHYDLTPGGLTAWYADLLSSCGRKEGAR